MNLIYAIYICGAALGGCEFRTTVPPDGYPGGETAAMFCKRTILGMNGGQDRFAAGELRYVCMTVDTGVRVREAE
jgi:hypothetical protein